MDIIFKNQLLADLYENKKIQEKEFKSNPQLVKLYIKTVNKLKSATHISQLLNQAGLRYEHLKGDRQGYCSVRVNDQYRLIFEELTDKGEVNVLALEELSNHYK